ncbi:YdcF family protein [Streptomyces sp. 549]|uniref:YdcF family protein n=1 Tax=Streptomyces sp. 549 TaxID=3049076 RepID=UPI0024C2A426|nr:YdcF family protein [Streptomyces sp. 549]MDK1472866.1 YdcF family protein [Streptomyces sp. 549]
MAAFAVSALFMVFFLVSVRADRRRFRNAVLLGLSLTCLLLGLLLQIPQLPPVTADIVIMLVVLVPALGLLALGVFLVANGLTMVRKEGRSLGNLLSLLTGLAVFAVIALLLAARSGGSAALDGLMTTTVLLSAYVSFLFACFLGYAYLYGRLAVRGDVDYVVVLGAGLLGGDRVPPLLAGRLHRARQIYLAQTGRGSRPPLLLTSGGQGPDEKVPEARAMADWLLARGVPEEHLRLERRSRTTQENMQFSRALMVEEKPDYRCVVVTNNFHAFRAAMTARRAGVNGQVLGSPTARYFWPSATIREFVAVFWEHRAVNLVVCAVLLGPGLLVTLDG